MANLAKTVYGLLSSKVTRKPTMKGKKSPMKYGKMEGKKMDRKKKRGKGKGKMMGKKKMMEY